MVGNEFDADVWKGGGVGPGWHEQEGGGWGGGVSVAVWSGQRKCGGREGVLEVSD